MTPRQLAESITDFVAGELDSLAHAYFSGLQIPRIHAGYPVGPDVRADLVFTLGLLGAAGRQHVIGIPIPEAITELLREVDGPATDTFFSYRIAETLLRAGPFDGNPLLADLEHAERVNVAEACDSSSRWDLETDRVRLAPNNYCAVIARCEQARDRLGILDDTRVLDRAMVRTLEMMTRDPLGHLDDSFTGIGRYDIYTADFYLFAEPLADRIGECWQNGFERHVDLVGRLAQRNGASFVWGRSTGALSVCLTLEMACAALARLPENEPGRWLALAVLAFRGIRGDRSQRGWIQDGLIDAHRGRSPYGYRGPHRRLQMTLDCLGKLSYAAVQLRESPLFDEDLDPLATPLLACDELFPLDSQRNAAVWCFRSRDLAFQLPLVGSTLADYLPAPRSPGVLDNPVEVDLPTGVPSLFRAGIHYTAGGIPTRVEKRDAELIVEYNGFLQSNQWEIGAKTPILPGSRRVRFTAAGRAIEVEDSLHLPELPDAVAWQIAECAERPLRVDFECDAPHRVSTIPTSGIKEYRSFWTELSQVHQLDAEPTTSMNVRYRVEPKLRVVTTFSQHHYHRSLYDPLVANRVHEQPLPLAHYGNPRAAGRQLRDADLFHMHWPEHLSHDLNQHRALLAELAAAEVRIIWTQHNRVPHSKDVERFDPIYRAWAQAAHGVIHHSEWGREQMLKRYPYRTDAVHRVIPHGHFGNLMAGLGDASREEAETELDLEPCTLRFGCIGAPKADHRLQMVMDAFAACARPEFQLLVLSLGPDDRPPDDPRIRALPHEYVSRAEFNRRLCCIDVLVIASDGLDYLTTGQFADAVGLGIPALTSTWPFLVEILGDAAIVFGNDSNSMTTCLDELDLADLNRAAAASRALQEKYAWSRIADLTLALFEEVGTARV